MNFARRGSPGISTVFAKSPGFAPLWGVMAAIVALLSGYERNLTAVPYAKTSAAPCMTSEDA